jgi:hypothetical protein
MTRSALPMRRTRHLGCFRWQQRSNGVATPAATSVRRSRFILATVWTSPTSLRYCPSLRPNLIARWPTGESARQWRNQTGRARIHQAPTGPF